MKLRNLQALVAAGLFAALSPALAQTTLNVVTAGADIWVHAPERVAEGTAASVVVPREALLLFPTSQANNDREIA